MNTIADALPAEIRRVQELLPLYDAIPTGSWAATMMRTAIEQAHAAMMNGDVVEMVRWYEDLRGYKA